MSARTLNFKFVMAKMQKIKTFLIPQGMVMMAILTILGVELLALLHSSRPAGAASIQDQFPLVANPVVKVSQLAVPVAAIGDLKWKFKTGGMVATSPVIAHKLVYFGSMDKISMPLTPKPDRKSGSLKPRASCGHRRSWLPGRSILAATTATCMR
jgi:hypothetical protein